MLHSCWSRANIIFTFYTTVMGVVLVFIAFSSFLFPFHPKGSLAQHDIVLRPIPKRGYDFSRFSFDLNADLRDAFNWNTKQLFVWVTAEYSTPNFTRNQVVVWDHLVLDKEDANLDFVNEPIKYPFYDRLGELRGTDVVLSLRYALCPHTGFLWTRESSDVTKFTMPAQYTPSGTQRPYGH